MSALVLSALEDITWLESPALLVRPRTVRSVPPILAVPAYKGITSPGGTAYLDLAQTASKPRQDPTPFALSAWMGTS